MLADFAAGVHAHELRVKCCVIGEFTLAEREWDQFHTPRNLALALTGEVGELCEIFQWKGEVEPGLPGA